MKKVLLAAAIIGSAFMANAQDNFAPKKGDFGTEIQFAPFSGNEIFSNGGVLSGRYFFTNKDAFTLDFGLAGVNHKEVPNTDDGNCFVKYYNGEFSLTLGYQRHFYNFKRLDLYYGAKISYIHQFCGYKDQKDSNNWSWTNGKVGEYTDGIGNGFGIYLTTGLDFYVYKGLFVGCEINAGFKDIIATNAMSKSCNAGVLTETKGTIGGHDFNGGFSVKPLLRLGWTF